MAFQIPVIGMDTRLLLKRMTDLPVSRCSITRMTTLLRKILSLYTNPAMTNLDFDIFLKGSMSNTFIGGSGISIAERARILIILKGPSSVNCSFVYLVLVRSAMELTVRNAI